MRPIRSPGKADERARWSIATATLSSLLGELTLDAFIILSLEHPLDVKTPESLASYTQAHRADDVSFILEFSSNHYLQPPHELSFDFELAALIAHGWELPPREAEGQNSRRVACDANSAAPALVDAACHFPNSAEFGCRIVVTGCCKGFELGLSMPTENVATSAE